MRDQLVMSLMATQKDVPSASNSLDPVGNPANSGTESNDSPAPSHVVSLLDQLKAPKPSDFACKQKAASNSPPKGKEMPWMWYEQPEVCTPESACEKAPL